MPHGKSRPPGDDKHRHRCIQRPGNGYHQEPQSRRDSGLHTERIEAVINAQDTVGCAIGRGQDDKAVQGCPGHHITVPLQEVPGQRCGGDTKNHRQQGSGHVNHHG